MNATFGKKFDFDFKVSLVEETIPSDSNVWNHWTGNGNSGMDAVRQANGIDKTQLSNGHRKRPEKRTRKSEPNWNPIHGIGENAQLNENATLANSLATRFERQLISDKNPNVFFESTNNNKLEQRVLQWAGCTVRDNVDTVWVFW